MNAQHAHSLPLTESEAPPPRPHFAAAAKPNPSEKIRAIAKNAQVMALGPEWAPAFVALNNEVRAELAMDQKHYLKPITVEDLHTHTGARMPMIGVVTDKNCLIGGMLVTYPHLNEAKHITGYPLGMATPITALARSVMLKDVFAGCGLSGQMLDAAASLAIQSGHAYIMAKICDTNVASRALFERAGYERKVKHYFDATGDYPYWASFWSRAITGNRAAKPAPSLR